MVDHPRPPQRVLALAHGMEARLQRGQIPVVLPNRCAADMCLGFILDPAQEEISLEACLGQCGGSSMKGLERVDCWEQPTALFKVCSGSDV